MFYRSIRYVPKLDKLMNFHNVTCPFNKHSEQEPLLVPPGVPLVLPCSYYSPSTILSLLFVSLLTMLLSQAVMRGVPSAPSVFSLHMSVWITPHCTQVSAQIPFPQEGSLTAPYNTKGEEYIKVLWTSVILSVNRFAMSDVSARQAASLFCSGSSGSSDITVFESRTECHLYLCDR